MSNTTAIIEGANTTATIEGVNITSDEGQEKKISVIDEFKQKADDIKSKNSEKLSKLEILKSHVVALHKYDPDNLFLDNASVTIFHHIQYPFYLSNNVIEFKTDAKAGKTCVSFDDTVEIIQKLGYNVSYHAATTDGKIVTVKITYY